MTAHFTWLNYYVSLIRSLGVYEFDDSTTQGVLVTNIGNGVVTADAIKLVPV